MSLYPDELFTKAKRHFAQRLTHRVSSSAEEIAPTPLERSNLSVRLHNSVKIRLNSLASRYRIARLRLQGIEIDAECQMASNVVANLGCAAGKYGRIQICRDFRVCEGAVLEAWGGSIAIAENVFIGPYTVIYGHGGVTIGKDSLIAMHCRILSSNHTIPNQSHRIRWEPDVLLPTTIGEDVWLGAGVTVLGGVTIGDGCVVGAGAVVSKDLPPYSVAVGVPAKVVRMRE